jgi:ferredoxin
VKRFREQIVIKIHVDEHKCVGAGQCVMTAPEVFDQREEDGVVILLQDHAENALEPAVRKAAKLCPALAIRVEEA